MCVRKAEKNFMTDKIELDPYSICLEVTDYSPTNVLKNAEDIMKAC